MRNYKVSLAKSNGFLVAHSKWENICKSIRTMSDTQQMLTIISVF